MNNEKYKVGDWVFGIKLGTSDYNDEKHPVKIIEIIGNEFRYNLHSNPNSYYICNESGKYFLDTITRLATQAEIEEITGIKEFTRVAIFPFKMKDLTLEKSKIVQETLFKNGYKWCDAETEEELTKVYDGDSSVLYFGDFYNFKQALMSSDVVDKFYNEAQVPELTFEEFEKMYVNKEFVLPEKWCFKVTKDNYEEFKHLRKLSSVEGYITSKPFRDLGWGWHEFQPIGTEITFDQFKQYVLKEKKLSKEELLEKAHRDYSIGVVFKSIFTDKGLIRTIKPYYSDAIKMEYELNNDYIRCSKGMDNMKGGCSNPIIYQDGVWAEIISTPEVKPLAVDFERIKLLSTESYNYEKSYGDKNPIIGELYLVDRGRTNISRLVIKRTDWPKYEGITLVNAIEGKDYEVYKEEALKEEVKFEVGKWYMYYDRPNTFAKCKYTDKRYFRFDEYIDNKAFISHGGYSWDIERIGDEIGLLEIQQYLPSNHPDKLVADTPDKEEVKLTLCEDCMGQGTRMIAKLYPSGHTEITEICDTCNGEGWIELEEEIESEDSLPTFRQVRTEYINYFEKETEIN